MAARKGTADEKMRTIKKGDHDGKPAEERRVKVSIRDVWGIGGFVVLAFVVIMAAITWASRFGGGFWSIIGVVVASFVVLVVLAIIGRFLGVFGEGMVARFLDAALAAFSLGIGGKRSGEAQEGLEREADEKWPEVVERGVAKVKVRDEGIAPVAVGQGAVAEVRVERLHRQSGGAAIADVSEGATVIVGENVTVNNYYYVDGLPEAPNVEVRGLFEKGRELSHSGKYREAIEEFGKCLGLENDSKKRGALGLQIGNCYYGMRQYVKAAEYYAMGLRESRRARDPGGEASNLGSIANTYLERPAGTIESRGENVREAVEHYFAAVEIFPRVL